MIRQNRKNKVSPAPETISLKKQKLNSEQASKEFNTKFVRKRIEMDGNCLYRAILYCLKQNDESHYQFREEIYQFAKENKKYCNPIFEQMQENKTYEEYIETILQIKNWGGLFELRVAARMLNFNFVVYRPNSFEQFASYYFYTNKQTIYLEWENFNHFNSLIPNLIKIDLSKTSIITIEENKQEHNFKEIKENSVEDIKKDESVQKKKTFGKSRKLFPPSKHNGDMYNKIFLYLNYRITPAEINQKGVKDFKKYAKTHYILAKKSTNKFTLSRLQFQSKNNISIFTIPYLEDIPKIIQEAHGIYNSSVIKHNGILATKKKFFHLD